MTKIVYNARFGGFGLSEKAKALYKERSGKDTYGGCISRDCPILVAIVEEMGVEADGAYAHLLIRDIPAGTKYRIDEYDGAEEVITIDEYEWETA